jgi:hypothetical protein
MPKRRGRRMSIKEGETLGLACNHSLRTMASVLERAPHRKLRAHPQCGAATVSYCMAHALASILAHQRGGCANSWIPGCDSMFRHIWRRAARRNRLPDASNVRILTACRNSSRPRPSVWVCMCCHAARCGANCWRRCVGRGSLGRDGWINGARFPA